MVGSYMDAQEHDFRVRLHGESVGVARVGDEIVLSVRNDVLFNEDGLSGRGRDVIEHVAELLRHYDHSAVQVAGYTDSSGTDAQNYDLSTRRARMAADALIADGVPAGRVFAQGLGASHPKVATGAHRNEPRNRRIEIHVIAHPSAG